MSMALSEANVPGKVPSVSFKTVALPDQPSLNALTLQGELAEIAGKTIKYLDVFKIRLVNSATIEEFLAIRDKFFQKYLDMNMALSTIVNYSSIEPIEQAHYAQESLTEMERELTDKAQSYLGEDAYQELFFCISTLKSAARMLPRLQSVPPNDDKKDAELAGYFFITNHYAHMHLDCLRLAILQDKMLDPKIMDELFIGIKHASKAYAFARCGLDLRSYPASRYPKDLQVTWDDEDEMLAKCL